MAQTRTGRSLTVHLLTVEGEALTPENQFPETDWSNGTYVVVKAGTLLGLQINLLEGETRYVQVAFDGVIIFHGKVQGGIPLGLYTFHYAGLDEPLRFDEVNAAIEPGNIQVDFFIAGQTQETLRVLYVTAPLG